MSVLAAARKSANATITADGLLVVRTDYALNGPGVARVYLAGAVQETFTGFVTHERAISYAKDYAVKHGLTLNRLL